MSIRRKYLCLLIGLVCISLSMINCTFADDQEKQVSTEENNKELPNKYYLGATITGDLAKAIGVAVESFSKTKSDEPFDQYLVTVFEIEECYYVGISFVTTKILAGYPPRYCVDKQTYELKPVPKNIVPLKLKSKSKEADG